MAELNWDKVEQYISEGFIQKTSHPNLPLFIYNYTHLAQFKYFFPYEVRQCRGLVADINNRIVSKPFEKFFNYGDSKEIQEQAGIPLHELYSQNFEVYEKLDGSMITIVNDKEYGLIIASRGSFTSDQTLWAKEIYEEYRFRIDSNLTYVCELIHPSNRIVVDYHGQKALWLLTIVDNLTWEELSYDQCKFYTDWEHRLVKRFQVEHFNGYQANEILSRIYPNSRGSENEGIVIKFLGSNIRVKVKLEEYIRLHKILFQLSDKAIWEACCLGQSVSKELENEQGFPEEIISWAKEEELAFFQSFSSILGLTKAFFNSVDLTLPRKDIAAIFKRYPYPQILFGMLDKYEDSRINEMIWKLLKPEKTQFFTKRIIEE